MNSWQARRNRVGRGVAVSLAGIWGLLLVSGAGCYATNSIQGADTNTSWLVCRVQADCSDGYSCVRGQCTPSSESEPDPALVRSALHAELDRDSPFVVSDTERWAGPPTVRWAQDHWVAAWWSASTREASVAVAQIAANGDVEARRLQPVLGTHWTPNAMITEDGRLALLRTDSCALEIFDATGQMSADSFSGPCRGDINIATATPVPGSMDWLFAYAAGDKGGDFFVGRYRPDAEAWLVPPIRLGSRTEYAALNMFTMGEDVIVASGDLNGTSVVTVPELASPTTPATDAISPQTPVHMSADLLGTDTGFRVAPTGARNLAMGTDGQRLWVAPLNSQAESPTVRELAPGGIAHRRPGVASVPELDVTGVCFAASTGAASSASSLRDAVSFMLVDSQGRAVGEPLVIADGLYNVGGCDLAWSGAAFLVAWWDIEIGGSATPTDSTVRATIVRVHE